MGLTAAAGSIIAGGIGAGGGFIQGHFNRKQQRRNVDTTIRANRELAEYAYKKDLEMWNRQNEYNSPSAQMKRFKAGGLNPHLIYGQGSVAGNTSGSAPSYQPPKEQYDYLPQQVPEIGKYVDTALRQAQVDNVRANTENTDARTLTELVREGLMKHESAIKKTESMVAAGTAHSRIESAGKHLEILSNQADASKYLKPQAIANLGKTEKETLRTNLLAEFQKHRNKWERIGITSGDRVWIRMAIKILPQLGISEKALRGILGDNFYKMIIE